MSNIYFAFHLKHTYSTFFFIDRIQLINLYYWIADNSDSSSLNGDSSEECSSEDGINHDDEVSLLRFSVYNIYIDYN